MALVMTAAPSVEPISLAEAKAHLRIDASDEDSLLTSLITAGRIFVERTLSLALVALSRRLAAQRHDRVADPAVATGNDSDFIF